MFPRCLFPILILSAQASLLRAQAVIGYGAVSGQSAAAAGAAATGKAAAGVLGKLNQTLAGAVKGGDASKPAPAPAISVAAAASKPAASFAVPPDPLPPADFSALAIGMERADLLKKVGKPSMTISSVESSVLVENCSYRKGADTVAVTLRDGKVTAFTGTGELPVK